MPSRSPHSADRSGRPSGGEPRDTPPARARPEHVIQVRDEYYILASSSLADDRTRVVKDGETFAVLDRSGDIHPVGRGQQGLYHRGTRYLSRLELRVEGERPLLLSSTVTEDNAIVAVDLTLRVGAEDPSATSIPPDSVHLFRLSVLWKGICHQRIRIRSFAAQPVRLAHSLRFGADFADLFEVRGLVRARRGELLRPVVERDSVVLSYRGLDGAVRRVALRFDPAPIELSAEEARFSLHLEPGEERTLHLAAVCDPDGRAAEAVPHEAVAAAARSAMAARTGDGCRIDTSNEQFNDWLNRSTADLRMMLTETEHGLYPYAGVPWFSAPFGRDGIVTALEMLWLDPSVAVAVLRFLAATQASELVTAADAEPGKILHEARGGEMAALGEVPFRRYYGSVDATPLFVLLAHATFERTGDRSLLEELWPHVVRALEWIDVYGDRDGDGFVEYERRTPAGLANQGWKDSSDSVFHADGRPAEGPIALCEVQALVYGAKRGAAELAKAMGDLEREREIEDQASDLQRRFEETFWLEDLGTYALALDGEKAPCRVRSSNAGQCLYTGIASFERARMVAKSLLDENSFSGWGIRTVPRSERRYNPMSYHNGSVWPHDNALIAAGLARYGATEAVLRILTGLFDATLFLDLHRMPELFCGFHRRHGEGPTLYPVACAPQSWSAATVFLLLQASLGIRIAAENRRILFVNPALPPSLGRVRIRGLRVGHASVDLELRRHPDDVGLQVVRREGDLDVVVVK